MLQKSHDDELPNLHLFKNLFEGIIPFKYLYSNSLSFISFVVQIEVRYILFPFRSSFEKMLLHFCSDFATSGYSVAEEHYTQFFWLVYYIRVYLTSLILMGPNNFLVYVEISIYLVYYQQDS